MAGARSKADVTSPLRYDERLRILEAATEKMRKEGALDSNLNLGVMASRTVNYDRPELELLVRLAQGNALSTQLLRNRGDPTTEGLKLTINGDFTSAMVDVKPASENER
ncbi:hypothetical protein ARALYDRAFT_354558 [Arabidopsis lyrata subsp. lyrata]|uniref:Uncharacterized protein n=1 Tax=Arabidopsis lyrata subsp. lyrata TaxID=81972 RepID=D7ME90_ARALL|nr:hypothetical protein ARALYDRAFT_354558 [Arabidopsis lyrata subsp. lyrata]